jgi:hypothetical protein
MWVANAKDGKSRPIGAQSLIPETSQTHFVVVLDVGGI